MTVSCPKCEGGEITVSVQQQTGPGYYTGLLVEDVRPCPACGCPEAQMEQAAYDWLDALRPD